MAGDVIIDVGFRGEYENPVPILPHAIGVDVDYPGDHGVTLPFCRRQRGYGLFEPYA